MIPRAAHATLADLARGFPVLSITGPRQSGKTTLARAAFPHLPYANLEVPDIRAFASEDARGFLAQYPEGAILDEVQRVPELLSWIQGIVDERKVMGMFVLTGSRQFELSAQITQSLAGRVGRLELLPLSARELNDADLLPERLDELLLHGGYPAPYDRDVDVATWLGNYVATYVERDVRQVMQIRDLAAFARFVALCAGRTGQLLNMTALGNDAGVSTPTALHWLSVLEASYVISLVRPLHVNLSARLVKTPKLYFLDTGLAAYLIGIRDAQTLATHISRGPLFETFVMSELVKESMNRAHRPEIGFLRDKRGQEVDLVIRVADGLQPIEIKAGQTYQRSWSAPMRSWQTAMAGVMPLLDPCIVYGGEGSFVRDGSTVVGWRQFATHGLAALD